LPRKRRTAIHQSAFSSLVKTVRRHQSNLGVGIVQTRLVVSLGVLLLAGLTAIFENPAQLYWGITAYIAVTVLFVLIFRKRVEQKRVRAIPVLFDLIVISFLVRATGGLESSWFLFYAFPVMSISRYLGTRWSVAVAILAAIGYGLASNVFLGASSQAIYPFLLRSLALGGAALMAANLAMTRDRAEGELVKAIEEIDRKILGNTDLREVMLSILNAAMDITESDLSAIVLVDGEKVTGTYAATKATPGNTSGESERNKSEVSRLVQQHYRKVLDSRDSLSLPKGSALAAAIGAPVSKDSAKYWPARLVPLGIEGTPFGVLGVFSRRRLRYYTLNDLRKLSSMVHLVAMAQKNAKLYRDLAARELESKERLQMLYQIGAQLKAEQGLDQVFQNVVTLVAERLGAEEAALFIPDERETRVEKVAVSGPDEKTRKRLMEFEFFYKKGRSFTGRVFKIKEPIRENDIPLSDLHADVYSKQLPSGRTKHYLGVPILIGDEILGVIRILNKKAEDYAPQDGRATLAGEGFAEADVALLETIATQVASAIRNAQFVERTRYFEEIVYSSPDPIIVVDKGGKVQHFNRECEKIWGLSEREVLGTSVVDYYKSAGHAREINKTLWSAEGHTIQNKETWIRAKGIDIPIRLSATLLLDKYGQPAGSIGAFKDEREIRHQEEEKIRAEKLAALGRLAQTTVHDIKHNIASILNYVDSLERGASGDARSQQVFSAIRGATAAVLSKVQNMLMTANPKPPQKEIVSLKSILIDFEGSIAHEAKMTRIEVSARYPKADALVLAEAEQMRQVLSILFGNSVDAIKSARAKGRRSAGKIGIILDGDQDIVKLSWRDDGCGMSESARKNAFTPFHTTKKTGNGLGLFISKTVVENHGGQITVESSEGGGAWFRIELPRYLPSENAQTEASREA